MDLLLGQVRKAFILPHPGVSSFITQKHTKKKKLRGKTLQTDNWKPLLQFCLGTGKIVHKEALQTTHWLSHHRKTSFACNASGESSNTQMSPLQKNNDLNPKSLLPWVGFHETKKSEEWRPGTSFILVASGESRFTKPMMSLKMQRSGKFCARNLFWHYNKISNIWHFWKTPFIQRKVKLCCLNK